MEDRKKTKHQLLIDLEELRERVSALETELRGFKASAKQQEREFHRTKEESERFYSLLESIPDEVWFCDADANISLANSAAARGLGFERVEEVMQHMPEWLPKLEIYQPDGTLRQEHDAPLLRSLRGEVLKCAEEIVRHPLTGELMHRQVSSSPVMGPSGQIEGAVAVVRDITPLKEAEKALQRAQQELERQMEQRTAQLIIKNEQLKREVEERKKVQGLLHHKSNQLESANRILANTLRVFDLDRLLEVILDEVMSFLNVEFGGIHLVQGEQLLLRTWKGLSPTFRAHLVSFPSPEPPPWLGEFSLLRADLNAHGIIPAFARAEGAQTWASIPLSVPMPQDQGAMEWLGSIFVASRNPDALNKDDVEALRKMTDQLVLAIDHSRAYREAGQRLVRLEVLREIDRAMVQQLDLKEVLHAALDRVPKELGADAAAISLIKEGLDRPEVSAMRLPNGILVEEEAFFLAESLLHWFQDRQEAVIIYDIDKDPRLQMHRAYLNSHKLTSYLGVPLIARNRTLGILHILSKEARVFADEDVEFFKIMAGQVAIAVENARLFDETRRHALQLEKRLAELEQVSRALKESSDRLAEAHRIARMGNWVWDIAQNEISWSEEIFRIFGLTPQTFGGTYEAFLDCVHPGDRDLVRKAVEGALYGGRGYSIDHRIVLPDGSERIVHERGEVHFDEARKPIRMIGTVQDVTREKELERIAGLQEKMASLGRMASGIAHEIRNPLSGINIFLEAIRENLGDPGSTEDLEGLIDEAGAAAARIEAVVRRIMDFSRPGRPQMSLIDINRPIEEVIKLSADSLEKSGIELETDLDRNLPPVYADYQSIGEVLLNLISNAEQAMEGISDKKRILLASTREKERVFIKVSDSGPGVPPGMRKKIFEPFYTTREGGSGIGLSICQRIIADQGGAIEVSGSELGGAEFLIRIPIEKRSRP